MNKKEKLLIGFVTAGDPDFTESVKQIVNLAKSGVSIIEIGLPFSDPVADGPVIQEADLRAFEAGMTTNKVFELVSEVRKQTKVPIVFLSYCNLLFKFGYENFFQRCQKLSVSGVVIPDLPFEEQNEILPLMDQYNVNLIPLITPTSGEARIKKIVSKPTEFIYLVSSLGVTGTRDEFNNDLKTTISLIRKYTSTPIAIGFGIHTALQAKEMSQMADGVIVGSGIVEIIGERTEQVTQKLTDYVGSLKDAIS